MNIEESFLENQLIKFYFYKSQRYVLTEKVANFLGEQKTST